MYYVYSHSRKSDNKVFYIGKGKDQRAWDVDGRTRAWMKVACENGRNVNIIVKGIDEESALRIEMMLIASYRANGDSLVNVTAGTTKPAPKVDFRYKERWWSHEDEMRCAQSHSPDMMSKIYGRGDDLEKWIRLASGKIFQYLGWRKGKTWKGPKKNYY